jgi:transposase InsO family protein
MSRALDDWAYQHGVQLDFIRPGKPVENAFIESFNGRAGRVPERPPVHLDRRRQGQD